MKYVFSFLIFAFLLFSVAGDAVSINRNNVDRVVYQGLEVDEVDLTLVLFVIHFDVSIREAESWGYFPDANGDYVVDGKDYESVFNAAVAEDPTLEGAFTYSGILRDMTYPLNRRTTEIKDKLTKAVGAENAMLVTEEDLQKISFLELDNEGISSLKKGDFEWLTGVIRLNLASNGLSDITHLAPSAYAPSEAHGLKKMQELNLNKNDIVDISVLSRFPSLRKLDVAHNNVSDVSALQGLSNLWSLNLAANDIKDITALGQMSALYDLNIAGNPVGSLAPLLNSPRLRHLTVSVSTIISSTENTETIAALREKGVTISPIF